MIILYLQINHRKYDRNYFHEMEAKVIFGKDLYLINLLFRLQFIYFSLNSLIKPFLHVF